LNLEDLTRTVKHGRIRAPFKKRALSSGRLCPTPEGHGPLKRGLCLESLSLQAFLVTAELPIALSSARILNECHFFVVLRERLVKAKLARLTTESKAEADPVHRSPAAMIGRGPDEAEDWPNLLLSFPCKSAYGSLRSLSIAAFAL
jgi:hypothetical protein